MSVALKWLPEACILYNLLTLSASRRKVRYSSISPTCPLYAIKLIPPESARYVQLVDSCCKSQFVHVTYDSSLEILQIPSFDVFAECLQEEVAVWLAHRSRFTSWVSCCTSHFQHVKFSDSQWDRKCWLFGKVVLSLHVGTLLHYWGPGISGLCLEWTSKGWLVARRIILFVFLACEVIFGIDFLVLGEYTSPQSIILVFLLWRCCLLVIIFSCSHTWI